MNNKIFRINHLFWYVTISLLLCESLFGNKILVPTDSLTIQGGINGCSNGDTVLIDPGVYHETINYLGKNILVTSKYILTGDTTYISRTVINGDSSGSVVSFLNQEDSTATLLGFTLTKGYNSYGGGICCTHSNPTIKHLIISDNSAWSLGGGIYCGSESKPTIEDVSLNNNSGGNGGGIAVSESGPILRNVQISNNNARYGGGIYVVLQSKLFLQNVTIKKNIAETFGGGLFNANSELFFDPDKRCNIYKNYAKHGCDLSQHLPESVPNPDIIHEVYLDTFTVIKPTDYYALPMSNFTFSIQNAIDSLIEADLYVSPKGSDSNTGISSDQPLLSLSKALSKISADYNNPRRIFLAAGSFDAKSYVDKFPLTSNSYVSIVGAGKGSTCVLSDNENPVFYFYGTTNASLSDLTVMNGKGGIVCNYSDIYLKNLEIKENTNDQGGGIELVASCPIIEDVIIKNNNADSYGGGVYCGNGSSPYFKNVKITNNYAGWTGGGIHFFAYVSPILIRTQISNNSAGMRGGGIDCKYYASPKLINVTIADNYAKIGGGINCDHSNPTLINSILWFNKNQQINFFESGSTIKIVSSNIEDSVSINSDTSGSVYFFGRNIFSDPKFFNRSLGVYKLLKDSPCINIGISDTTIISSDNKDTITVPYLEFTGVAPDLGAIESSYVVDIFNELSPSYHYKLFPAYPNPFNATTCFNYSIAEKSRVQLEIFNLQGQLVKTLVNHVIEPGNYRIIWDATTSPSGVYFYRLQSGDFQDIKKCLLIK